MKGLPIFLFDQEIYDLTGNEELFPISVRDKLIERPGVHDDPELMDMMYSGEWKQLVGDFDFQTLSALFSFEELARISYDSVYFFRDQVQRSIEYTPAHRLLQKIKSSFWRWGKNNDATTWGTAVKVFRQMKSFQIPLPNFTVALDWTTGFNERGYSESARIFLDGVFAYLVHHNGEHVMTIGFSFSDDGSLLIQQVQLAKKKGNRFIYRLGSDHMSWALSLMRSHFLERDVYVVEGESLATYICGSYLSRATYFRSEFSRQRSFLYSSMKEQDKKYLMDRLKSLHQEYKAYWKKVIKFREEDLPRIVKLYSFCELSTKKIKINNLTFGLLS